MTIRKAIINDLESLSFLFDNYRKFYHQKSDVQKAILFLRDRLVKNDSEIFIVENNNRDLLGFVQLYPIFSSTRMKRLWLLNDLFIEAGHRSNGYSIALINECKELCRRTDSCGMILETAKDNTIGNNLYLKTGFLPDIDHNYYEWTTLPT